MLPNLFARRVAARYLKRKQATSADSVGPKIQSVQAMYERISARLKLVEDLLTAGERRRLGRIHDINVGPIQFDGQRVTAKVAGTTGSYDVRITVSPKRGHRCSCPDWEQNGDRVGPCKHVLALATAWKNESLTPAMDHIESNLDVILQRWD